MVTKINAICGNIKIKMIRTFERNFNIIEGVPAARVSEDTSVLNKSRKKSLAWVLAAVLAGSASFVSFGSAIYCVDQNQQIRESDSVRRVEEMDAEFLDSLNPQTLLDCLDNPDYFDDSGYFRYYRNLMEDCDESRKSQEYASALRQIDSNTREIELSCGTGGIMALACGFLRTFTYCKKNPEKNVRTKRRR